jgi:Mlc titration factor MtfA (ptsG expression regulator)
MRHTPGDPPNAQARALRYSLADWWHRLTTRFGATATSPAIPQALWDATLARHPFLAERNAADLQQLRLLSAQFLGSKQFSGAHGLQITDEMALAIAAQACLPVLKLGLHWYDDFSGIVVHPDAMLARREVHDEAGVVHHYQEELSGEAMPGGPVTLSWRDVQEASIEDGYNVVIHEFVHKLDMRDGVADGCPPMPSRALARRWQTVMQAAFRDFKETLSMANRFGGPQPWLDPYAATDEAEFFAVAAEAFFVSPVSFQRSYPDLYECFCAYFRQNPTARMSRGTELPTATDHL